MTEWKSRGSQPRCILLTDGGPFVGAENLTRMVNHPEVTVSASDTWRPEGRPYPHEVQLDKRDGDVLMPREIARALRDWWLVNPDGRSPNWDIASTCTTEGQRGLLLVEAKAHSVELSDSRASGGNREKVEAALAEANGGLRSLTGEVWGLSADRHYQLANRIAWAWKLAALGMPTVLVYLAFLNAAEMTDRGRIISSAADWDARVRRHSTGVVPPSCWNTPFHVSGVPLMLLIRTYSQSLKTWR